MRRIIITGILSILLACLVNGQDPHFSQSYLAPVYSNPARSGYFDGKYRLGFNYRNQWNSITTPFKSFLTGYDMPLTRKRPGRDFVGAGLYFIRDKAGDADYGITAASVSASYFHSLSRNENHFLALGLAVSPVENSVNFNKLRFPDQFDGTQYDPGMSQGEYIGRQWIYYMDISLGLLWSLEKANGKEYSLGFSLFHINRPDHSLLRDRQIPLNIRWSIQGNTTYPLNSDLDLLPYFTFERQDKHTELIAGSLARYKKWSTPTFETVLYGGIANRWTDAVIIITGLENGYMNIGLSYDVNYSGLRKASYLRGGLEISLQYTFNKPQGVLKRDVTCPIF